MGAGQYIEPAVFQRKSDTGGRDADGNPTGPGWNDLFTVAVDIRATPGRERIAAGRLEAPATATIRLRYSTEAAALTGADRVFVRGATWAIVSPPVEITARPRVLELIAERGGAVQ